MSKLFTILLVLISCHIFSQPALGSLNDYFAELRTGKHSSIPHEITKPENEIVILSALFSYRVDTLSIIRLKTATITRLIGVKSKQLLLRQECVQYLIEACRDKDSGNVGVSLGYLTEFKKEDFSTSAKDSLRALFKDKPSHLHQLIKLIGFIELNDLQSDLHIIAKQTDASKRDRWAAQLALARMGDQAVMQSILDRVKKLPVNDNVVYEIFPDLIYTRQLEAVSSLTRVLFSDENNCESADAESEAKIPCAYRVMEQLAPVIEGYPLEVGESGDVKTKNYVAALKKTREWFRKQKEYKIIRDTY